MGVLLNNTNLKNQGTIVSEALCHNPVCFLGLQENFELEK
jgi:hypothetical protein